jgi:hypothetical protein
LCAFIFASKLFAFKAELSLLMDYASFENKLKTWPFGQHTRIKNAHRKAALSAWVFDPRET